MNFLVKDLTEGWEGQASSLEEAETIQAGIAAGFDEPHETLILLEVDDAVKAILRRAARSGTSDRLPHSRACGARVHPHGAQCSRNCPTCHGVALKPAKTSAQTSGSTS